MGNSSSSRTEPKSVFTGKATQIENQIKLYQSVLDNKDDTLKQAATKIGEYSDQKTAAEGESQAKQEQIDGFDIKKRLEAYQATVDAAEAKYFAAQNEIQQARQKTGVQSDLMSDFLQLTQAVIPNVDAQKKQIGLLENMINIMYSLISRYCSEQFYIREYLEVKNKAEQAIDPLNEAGATWMDDIVCTTEDDYNKNVLSTVNDGIAAAKKAFDDFKGDDEDEKAKLEKDSEPLKKFHLTFLKACCLQPQDWQVKQKARARDSRAILKKISPALVAYLDALNKAFLQARSLLVTQSDLSKDQQDALAAASQEQKDDAKKQLETVTNGDKAAAAADSGGDDEKETLAVKVDPLESSPLSGIKTLVTDTSLHKIFEENAILMSCVKKSLEIAGSEGMKKVFEDNPFAKAFAEAVEDVCQQLMRSMGNTRSELLLAQGILKLKPANISTEDASEYWDSMNGAIIVMYESSGVVFDSMGGLLTFYRDLEASLQRYVTAEDRSFLSTDLNNFGKYSKVLYGTFDKLDTSAMESIEEVIKNYVGSANFQAARDSVKADREGYRDAKATFNKRLDSEENLLFLMKQQKAEQDGLVAQATVMLEQWNSIKGGAQDTAAIQQTIADLQAKYAEASDYEIINITIEESHSD